MRTALAALRQAGDPERARGQRTYFKKDEDLAFFGVRTPDVRRLEREAWARVRAWTLTEGLAFADAMVGRPELEAKSYGFARLARFKKVFDRSVLRAATRWLAAGDCASWAAVDDLCHTVVTPCLVAEPSLVSAVQAWGRRRSLWLRRASLVALVPLARKGAMLDDAYGGVRGALAAPEDLMHKAAGWLLREAGRTDMKRLEEFLLEHGPAIPRTTVRYAIERFPERRRKQLLVATAQPR